MNIEEGILLTVNCEQVFGCEATCGGTLAKIIVDGKSSLILVCDTICQPKKVKKCCFFCEEECDYAGVTYRNDITAKFKIIAFLAKLKSSAEK